MTLTTLRNPRPLTDLWNGHEIGDPFMMRFDGRFYLYCSSHSQDPGIKCWMSEDMIHFDYQGFVCVDPRTSGAYAPEVAYNAGKFWMVTSPKGSGHYLLVSDSPLGPFEVVSDNLGVGIDGSIFVDDDGRSWFYRASHQGIRVHEMPAPDEIDVRSQPIEASWLGHWTEGPQVVKRDGRYFLTDTGNHVCCRGYHIDYMVSHEGADRGYRKLRDSLLLQEIRDEYHALGHSSTCVGPDMDTLYIVYHKNIINERNIPHYRSLCIDRLHFNGDRMYCNATWWNQPAPVQPLCVSRDGEGLTEHPLGYALPVKGGKTCTAEINIRMMEEKCSVFFAGYVLSLHADRTWTLSSGQTGTFPANVAMDAMITVKASLHQNQLEWYVNGMHFLSMHHSSAAGDIGVGAGCKPSFVGFSGVAQGSEDAAVVKSVPGAFDGVHSVNQPLLVTSGESGCKALMLHAGMTAAYAVNVWQTRKYHLAVALRASGKAVTLVINGQAITAPATGAADADGLEKRYFGEIELQAGYGQLTIQAQEDVAIDRIYLAEADAFAPMTVIAGGQDVSGGAMIPAGHKARQSMHRKFCGYTAAEGYGEAHVGGQWRDYALRLTLNMKPCSPEAQASVYLRERRESWHPHQVAASRHAYAVKVTEGQIALYKQQYGEELLAQAALNVAWSSQLKLTVRVQGSRITVEGEEGLLLEATDSMPLICGRVGLSAVTDGIGFESLEICEA